MCMIMLTLRTRAMSCQHTLKAQNPATVTPCKTRHTHCYTGVYVKMMHSIVPKCSRRGGGQRGAGGGGPWDRELPRLCTRPSGEAPSQPCTTSSLAILKLHLSMLCPVISPYLHHCAHLSMANNSSMQAGGCKSCLSRSSSYISHM